MFCEENPDQAVDVKAMRVSVITVAYNSRDTIEDTILSVASQTYPEVEHVVVDGASTDGTTNLIRKYENTVATIISEPDQGIYDAMNKGISHATGDIVGILNADDVYHDKNVLAAVVEEFERTGADSIFADLVYVRRKKPDKVVRYYRSHAFTPHRFAFGWMPAHPTFFARRYLFNLHGGYKTDYRIAADYELLVRFLATGKVSYSYLPRVLVKMRMGGRSTRSLKSNWILNREIVRACRENAIPTNMIKVLSKYPTKILQLVQRPR
jgi:glycosyltransferase involved in cell wall biosynthesis